VLLVLLVLVAITVRLVVQRSPPPLCLRVTLEALVLLLLLVEVEALEVSALMPLITLVVQEAPGLVVLLLERA